LVRAKVAQTVSDVSTKTQSHARFAGGTLIAPCLIVTRALNWTTRWKNWAAVFAIAVTLSIGACVYLGGVHRAQKYEVGE
jgi:hypothetical protein